MHMGNMPACARQSLPTGSCATPSWSALFGIAVHQLAMAALAVHYCVCSGTTHPPTFIPSLAKLMPSAGSGISGGTSSAGKSTAHVPSGKPYKQRFSRSGSHCA